LPNGIATSLFHPAAFQQVHGELDCVIQVGDGAIKAAMRTCFRAAHNVAEGAGAASLAAVLQEKKRLAGEHGAAILTGGNVDCEILCKVPGYGRNTISH